MENDQNKVANNSLASIADYLKYMHLGIISLVGIIVPGLLFLFLFGFGLLLPLAVGLLALPNFETVSWNLFDFYDKAQAVIIISLLILTYLIGYITRLTTPDFLDRVSADRIIKNWQKPEKNKRFLSRNTATLNRSSTAEEDSWPYRGQKGDELGNKYPYFYFRQYLESRQLHHLAELVTWGKNKEEGKRSKTAINLMKLYVAQHDSKLSSEIEANEAHIRLMSGTWLVINQNFISVLVGIAISLTTLISFGISIQQINAAAIATLIVGLIHLFGMVWARREIESFFHYQRVREITFILACAYHTKYKDHLDAIEGAKSKKEKKKKKDD